MGIQKNNQERYGVIKMKTIGIDLGTYNSAAAVAVGKDTIMVESRYGRTLHGKNFPSFVLFDHNGEKQKVGQPAKAERGMNPKLVIWGVKRLIGLSFKDAESKGLFNKFEYDVEEGPGGNILIKVGEERYTPSHILEFILTDIKEDAENPRINKHIGGKIDRAVISVPAYFKAIRTGPIIEAAKRAGFTDVDTIAEPTAAAIKYGLKIDKESNILAFDIGAGTLDVSIMDTTIVRGELIPGELATSGHEELGGVDMDDLLSKYIINKYNLQIDNDPRSRSMLTDEVEKAKIRLSSRESTPLDLPDGRSVDLTRKELENVLKPLLDRCRKPIEVALQQAKLKAEQLDHALFVGGPTHMPCIRNVVKEELKRLGAKRELLNELDIIERSELKIDPQECVAQGAALKAGRIIEPVTKTIAEGYGTIFGSARGLPYYAPIIKEGSNYPISGKLSIGCGNIGALEVPIHLVTKRPDGDKSNQYRYEYLGDYVLSIKPTGECPLVDIFLQISDKKDLTAILTHTQTFQQVSFKSLDLMKGEDIGLQEGEPNDDEVREIIEKMKRDIDENNKHGYSWTRKQLENYIHVAQEALYLVKNPNIHDVKNAMKKLDDAIKKATGSNYRNPNDDCPNISNRIKELLNTLCQRDIRQITQEESRAYMSQLTEIANMK